MTLGDGRIVRLAGLDPATQTPGNLDLDERSRAELSAMIAGRTATIQILAPKTDRWGRVVAFVFVKSGGKPDDDIDGGLTAASIKAGLGRYRSEPLAHLCREAFVFAEDGARKSGLGLWADPYYAVLAVDDHAAFDERSGTIVVAEGLLRTVVPGPYRTKLLFATQGRGLYGGHALAVTILPRTMKTFETQHVMLPSLIGRLLRVRGLLDQKFGPQIEIESPDDVDVLESSDGAPPAAASRSNE